jgi:hypothetical protein
MTDVHTFINRDGVNTYRANLHLGDPGPQLIGLNTEDSDGYTPLMYVVKHCNEQLVSLLLSRGAEINHKNKQGETAMTVAVKRGNPVLVNFLFGKMDEEARGLAIDFLIEHECEERAQRELQILEEKERVMREKRNPMLSQLKLLEKRGPRLIKGRSLADAQEAFNSAYKKMQEILAKFDEEYTPVKQQLDKAYVERGPPCRQHGNFKCKQLHG